MSTVTVCEKAEAFTRTVSGLAHANVIEISEPEPVDFKTPPSDVAADIAKDVIRRFLTIHDAKNANPAVVRRSHEGNCPLGSCFCHASIIPVCVQYG